jgi:hypothetical protein
LLHFEIAFRQRSSLEVFMRATLKLSIALGILICVPAASPQQVNDPNFRFENPSPAFTRGKGPTVCIDSAHNNFHTVDGRYKGYAELLRGDGYVVRDSNRKFTPAVLAACQVMLIANPVADANKDDWAYPHPSTFTREEIEAVYRWVHEGGRLLLFVDHSPFPGAMRDLGAFLGTQMLDAYAILNPGAIDLPDVFTLADQSLRPHPILAGRNEKEKVDAVATFGGSAFLAAPNYTPLLVLPPTAVAAARLGMNFENLPISEWPRVPVGGFLQGAAGRLGKGRVVVMGEAAMCSAQLAGPQKQPMGMNHPRAAQNPQFCLNIARWLSGILGD